MEALRESLEEEREEVRRLAEETRVLRETLLLDRGEQEQRLLEDSFGMRMEIADLQVQIGRLERGRAELLLVVGECASVKQQLAAVHVEEQELRAANRALVQEVVLLEKQLEEEAEATAALVRDNHALKDVSAEQTQQLRELQALKLAPSASSFASRPGNLSGLSPTADADADAMTQAVAVQSMLERMLGVVSAHSQQEGVDDGDDKEDGDGGRREGASVAKLERKLVLLLSPASQSGGAEARMLGEGSVETTRMREVAVQTEGGSTSLKRLEAGMERLEDEAVWLVRVAEEERRKGEEERRRAAEAVRREEEGRREGEREREALQEEHRQATQRCGPY
eukprot:3940744-Rhodomonas_salina.5